MIPGCTPERPPATKPERPVELDDPLVEVREAARKDHNALGCKTIVDQLNTLLENAEARKPSPLTAAERDLLTKQLRLNDEQLNEVSRENFSPLDAHYLEECFFFHDAIQSLDLDFSDASDAAQLKRAERAFASVMRQVWLRDLTMPLAPPPYRLKRG